MPFIPTIVRWHWKSAELFENGDTQFASVSSVTELTQVNALPGSEVEPVVSDGNGDLCSY